MTGFTKFPHTPHLAWLGAAPPRADKVLDASEVDAFLKSPIVVEEKYDGANVGISFDSSLNPSLQNRGTILEPGSQPQFQALWPWFAERQFQLAEALTEEKILFGEWCFAKHSVHYNRLPDYFLTIDVYDKKEDRFWSADRRDELASSLNLQSVPRLAAGRFTLEQLKDLLRSTVSQYGSEPAEGLYLRLEENGWLKARAKLVRAEFVQAIDVHWSSQSLERNKID